MLSTYPHLFFFLGREQLKSADSNLGLLVAEKKMKMIDPKEAKQLVLDQLDLDPARHQGPRVIRHKLARRTGEHLSRDFITNTMRIHDNDSFDKRDPTSKIHRARPVA